MIQFNANMLLIVTAVIELATGIVLLIAPSQAAKLLLGAGLDSPASVMVGRVAGAALVSIGLNCWLTRNRDRGRPRTGLIVGLLTYNVSIPVLLGYAAIGEGMHGLALWPACGLHSALAIWCTASLRSGTNH